MTIFYDFQDYETLELESETIPRKGDIISFPRGMVKWVGGEVAEATQFKVKYVFFTYKVNVKYPVISITLKEVS